MIELAVYNLIGICALLCSMVISQAPSKLQETPRKGAEESPPASRAKLSGRGCRVSHKPNPNPVIPIYLTLSQRSSQRIKRPVLSNMSRSPPCSIHQHDLQMRPASRGIHQWTGTWRWGRLIIRSSPGISILRGMHAATECQLRVFTSTLVFGGRRRCGVERVGGGLPAETPSWGALRRQNGGGGK